MKPMTMQSPTVNATDIRYTWRLLILVSLVGLAYACFIHQMGFDDPMKVPGHAIFLHLFTRNEPIQVLLILVFLIAAGMVFRRFEVRKDFAWPEPFKGWKPSIVLIALVVLMVTWVGTFAVFRNYALSMDEFGADFQARLFAAGQYQVTVPEEWQPYVKSLTPTFIRYNPETHGWVSSYLPGNAAWRSLFVWIGVPSLANPLLAALTVLFLAATARNIWPGDHTKARLCALLISSSAAFIITSMTAYAWPAHLCLNVLWLYFYTRNDRIGYGLTPWVGIAAMSLHQPIAHALFATPFLLRLLWRRQWLWSLYFLGVYCLGILGCAYWLELIALPGAVSQGLWAFYFDWLYALVMESAYVIVLVAWQSPILTFLFLLSWNVQNKDRGDFFNDLRWSCLITFFFYWFSPNQGHGWGGRYFYPVWGNVVLLSVLGWDRLKEVMSEGMARTLLLAGLMFAWLVQIPLRGWQVQQFVEPYARANAFLKSLPADAIILDTEGVWYACDLIRNGPRLDASHMRLERLHLTEEQIQELKKRHTVAEVSREKLIQFGLLPCAIRRKPWVNIE